MDGHHHSTCSSSSTGKTSIIGGNDQPEGDSATLITSRLDIDTATVATTETASPASSEYVERSRSNAHQESHHIRPHSVRTVSCNKFDVAATCSPPSLRNHHFADWSEQKLQTNSSPGQQNHPLPEQSAGIRSLCHQQQQRPASPCPSVASTSHYSVSSSCSTKGLGFLNPRQRFLLFIKILFKCLAQADEPDEVLQKSKRIVAECTRKNRQGDPTYTPLMDAVECRLREYVGETHWRRSLLLMRHYIMKKTNNKR